MILNLNYPLIISQFKSNIFNMKRGIAVHPDIPKSGNAKLIRIPTYRAEKRTPR
jgi:hypothetical protein